MKHLKIFFALILVVIFATSCEKEIVNPNEINEIDNQKIEYVSFSEYIKSSGVDMNAYLNKTAKSRKTGKTSYTLKSSLEDIAIYDNLEDFNSVASANPIEDFEEGKSSTFAYLRSPLDEFSDNDIFEPGDILSGITFSTDYDGATSTEPPYDNLQEFIFIGLEYGDSKYIVNNFAPTDLIIDFEEVEDLNVVGMDVIGYGSLNTVNIRVMHNGEVLANINLNAPLITGTFFGITSVKSITQIILNANVDNLGFVGIDNVSFGTIDSDGDGIGDSVDNCPYIANPDQGDLDDDGIGNECDEDIDGDDVLDVDDNCPDIANSDQADNDEDGIGDVCDDDIDGDGIFNDDDNCPYIANSDQGDLDNDSFGNECDDDIDGDVILNDDDNCPFIANADQADYEGDGIGDLCDDDDDNDGCLDVDDFIQFSNMEATIIINECDTEVTNSVTSECGVMMSDLIDEIEERDFIRHGEFLREVTKLTKIWQNEGLITKDDRQRIRVCAAQLN